MKRVREVVTSVILVGALVTACATSSDAPVEETPEPTGTSAEAGSIKATGTDAATVPLEASVPQAKVCASNCHTDSECQTSCPAAPNGGLNCCDTSSGVCYASSSASCGGVDAGTD
jgi:hypothetical protein